MSIVKPRQFALFGFPLTYSLSPQIHKFLANQYGMALTYDLYPVTLAQLSIKLQTFVQEGGIGFNVTAPYKQEVYHHLHAVTAAAEIAGVVNTVKILADGSWYGDNTDGVGLLFDLDKNQVQIKNQKILILGAGGAVSGILYNLSQRQPAQIILVNRDYTKALQSKYRFKNLFDIDVITYADLFTVRPDIIINATIPQTLNELYSGLSQLCFRNTICYDLNYAPSNTDFMHLAMAKGAYKVINGLGMLVAQAAYGFNFWHGFYPAIAGVLTYLQQVRKKSD